MTLRSGLDVEILGARVRRLRDARGWSLASLATAASVSRSMLSSIERGEKVPTVLVLDSIATALGTTLSRLVSEERDDAVVLLRREAQVRAGDGSGWERRVLSPVLPGVEFEFMRTELGPRVDAGVFLPHGYGAREYVAVETGVLRLSLPDLSEDLDAGDAIYFAGDVRHGFANPSDTACVYYLAMDVAVGGTLDHSQLTGSLT